MRNSLRLHLAGERGCGYLQNHEGGVQSGVAHQESGELAGLGICHLLDATLGNSRKRSQRDRKLIRSDRERLPMKISSANYFAGTRFRIRRGKNQRISSGAV